MPETLTWARVRTRVGSTAATPRTGDTGKTIRQPGVLAWVHARRRGHGLGHGGRPAIIAATTPSVPTRGGGLRAPRPEGPHFWDPAPAARPAGRAGPPADGPPGAARATAPPPRGGR